MIGGFQLFRNILHTETDLSQTPDVVIATADNLVDEIFNSLSSKTPRSRTTEQNLMMLPPTDKLQPELVSSNRSACLIAKPCKLQRFITKENTSLCLTFELVQSKQLNSIGKYWTVVLVAIRAFKCTNMHLTPLSNIHSRWTAIALGSLVTTWMYTSMLYVPPTLQEQHERSRKIIQPLLHYYN